VRAPSQLVLGLRVKCKLNYIAHACVFFSGNCGSCYAFSAAAMLEARIRILTNNKVTPIYSPQDIVDCSPYSEGVFNALH